MASSTVPKEINALISSNKSATVTTISTPELRPTYLLIKVHSVALNPTDWKHITHGFHGDPYSIVGCDYAGTVVSIGSEVTKAFEVGDRVFGCAHGSNSSQPHDGIFAEYAVVKGDVAMHVPDSVSFEEASTFPLGSITVGQGLFQQERGLGLHLPFEGKGNDEWLFIYGGSTATGTLGIQFAKLAGYKIVTTCSPKNNELVKSRGADEIYDYHDPACGSKIRELTKDKLRWAWDTVGVESSAKICADALSSNGSECHFGTILFNELPRDDGVKYSATTLYIVFGEEFQKFGRTYPGNKGDFEFGKYWVSLTERLVKEAKLKSHPARIGSGGLHGVLKGLDEMKSENVSGEKLVYTL